MLGHVYFDRAFSKRFVEILEAEYNRPATKDKLWEELYIDHIKEFSMTMRRYPTDAINEFDSLDELRAFDPHFIENVDTDIFDSIVQVLGCTKAEIRDVYPLKQGLTNLSCHFRTDAGEYVSVIQAWERSSSSIAKARSPRKPSPRNSALMIPSSTKTPPAAGRSAASSPTARSSIPAIARK